jgi:hypothetical protein
MPLDSTNYGTLTAMISPALFLTATGSLIISTSNRMSRIVDRIRQLTELSDQIDRGDVDLDFPEHRRQYIAKQLDRLVWRSDRVRLALTMLYASLTAFVGTSLGLAVDVLLSHLVEAVPTMLAVAGVVLLMAASLELVREARCALRANNLEIEFHHELHAWRLRAAGTKAIRTAHTPSIRA